MDIKWRKMHMKLLNKTQNKKNWREYEQIRAKKIAENIPPDYTKKDDKPLTFSSKSDINVL